MTWTKRRIAAAAAAYMLLFGIGSIDSWVCTRLCELGDLIPALRLALYMLSNAVGLFFGLAYPLLVFAGTLFGGAIAVMRIWRRSAPGSARDPLVQLRDALRVHRRLASALPWTPLALGLLELARFDDYDAQSLQYPVAGAMAAIVVKLMLRTLDRVENREAPPPPQAVTDETVFRAVAVTPRSQALVVGVLGLSVAMVAFVANVKLAPGRTGPLSVMIFAYAAALVGAARWYQTASTIRVGTDGVFVQGTSKTRFHSYRDFDAVRVSGATLLLVRGTKTVARLQLHGADVERGAFLAERIEAALATARNVTGAESLLAHGGSALVADYRNASLSREQLWELLEADGTAGEARTTAAEMLATNLDPSDRTRLRIAASHTADPKVRIALEAFAGDVQPQVQNENGGEIGEETADPAAARRLVIP